MPDFFYDKSVDKLTLLAYTNLFLTLKWTKKPYKR